MKRLLMACAVATLTTLPADATTFVRVSDEALVDQAEIAAVVRVETRAAAAAGAVTEYGVRVEELLKGSAPDSFTVRVPADPYPARTSA